MDRLSETASAASSVSVECLACGHQGTLAGDDARLRGEPLSLLTRRLYCSACGSRALRAARTGTPRDVARFLRSRMRPGRTT